MMGHDRPSLEINGRTKIDFPNLGDNKFDFYKAFIEMRKLSYFTHEIFPIFDELVKRLWPHGRSNNKQVLGIPIRITGGSLA